MEMLFYCNIFAVPCFLTKNVRLKKMENWKYSVEIPRDGASIIINLLLFRKKK